MESERTFGQAAGFWRRFLDRLKAGYAWFSGGGAREEEIGELVLLRRSVGDLARELRADRVQRRDETAVLAPLCDVLASASSGEKWVKFRAAQERRDAISRELAECGPRMRHRSDEEKNPIRRRQKRLTVDLQAAQAAVDALYEGLALDDEWKGQKGND